IGEEAFYDCASLTSVTLPEGLTSIGRYAFRYCYDLDHVIFLGEAPEFGEGAFFYISPTVYYVEGDPTWNDDVIQKYGGSPVYEALGSPAELEVTVADPYPYYFVGDRVEKADVTATVIYDSGARSVQHPGKFEILDGDMSVAGVKVLTVEALGVRGSVTAYVHEGGAIETDPATWPESLHKYKNNTDDTQVLTVPGAGQIQITFGGQTKVESGADYLYVYDGTDAQIARYTGSEAAGKTLTVQGDTVKIRLVTDSSATDWGYVLSDVEAQWVEHVYESEGGTCTICGGAYVCPHSYGEGVITAEPTCQAEGITSYTCVRCGHVRQEAIPTRGHSYDVVTGICDMCGGRTPFSVEAPRMESCYAAKQTTVKSKWTKVQGVDGYELYMSTDRDALGSYERVKTLTDPDTLVYTKSGLTPGVTYYFRVCAFVLTEDGLTRVRSELSNADYTMPAVLWDAPYSNSDFRIRLRWEAVEGADGFQIWRKGEGEDYRVVKTVKDGATTAYSNVGLQSGGMLKKFKGGKGIATTCGVFTVGLVSQSWWFLLIIPVCYVLTLGLIYLIEYASLASLVIISAFGITQLILFG
ncbi:MAG: glycerol-3-phosphate acyltransferase, partial [Oscillospiraceae bacterium]|nr:glycerol-3-phosphate acyltransferase [Oscillospiraceae bacterium]